MKVLLSIIVPVYNVKTYIDRCIKSILTQSYRDFELILIDDGSTDGSSLLCDEWALRDKRIVVLHKVNEGVSAARNSGLDVANGDYITFVDSDDFVAPETYSENMGYLLEHQYVDILQYPYCHYIDENTIMNYHRPLSTLLIGKEQIFKNWWSGSPLEYVSWNKIYKCDIWNDIRFNVGHTSEDTWLVADFVKKATSLYISDKGLYYYQRNREDSYTYQYSFDKHLDLFYAHVAIYQCFGMFPNMVTEKVLAFTRLYRRLITAKQSDLSADIEYPLSLIKQNYPSWREIIISHHTDKVWLSIAKIVGANIFVKLFLKYLKQN